MIGNFITAQFIFLVSWSALCECRSFETRKDEQWDITCKKGYFASDIHTWYIEGSSGERVPSGVRMTCRNPLDPMQMQQIQAFETKEGSWHESRSCPFNEQIIGLTLWPSLHDSSSIGQEWNPQIICREQRQNSRIGRGRSLYSGASICQDGQALCGVNGRMVEIDSNKAPSFTNYGIKCCKLPKREPKKIVSLTQSNNKGRSEIPESKVFKLTLGPAGGRVPQTHRKPRRKSSTVPIKSKDFVLKHISPKVPEDKKGRKLPSSPVRAPGTRPVIKILKGSNDEHSGHGRPSIDSPEMARNVQNGPIIRIFPSAIENDEKAPLLPENKKEFNGMLSLVESANILDESEDDEDDLRLHKTYQSTMNEFENAPERSVSADKSNLQDSETDDFVPVYLVQKRGDIYRRSKCFWPESFPQRNYGETIDADLEVLQVRSRRSLIPVLLIKLHEQRPPSSRECFWPKVKTGRQLNGSGRQNLQPEFVVLTP